MSRQMSAVAILLFVVTKTSAVIILAPECPRGRDCTECDGRPVSTARIFCGTPSRDRNVHHFAVTYFRTYPDDTNKPNWAVSIICSIDNATNWSDFHLGTEKKLKYMSEITFEKCHFPQDRQLISIVNQLLDNVSDESTSNGILWNGTKTMRFISKRNLTMVLSRASFQGFNEYNKIDISDNKLRNVSEDLFRGFNSLTSLLLDRNDLQTISDDFLNFPNLTHLSLKRNKLQVIKNMTFANLPLLEKLILSNNRITKIESNSFDNNHKLIELYLDGNRIEILPPHIFDSLFNLEIVLFKDSRFTDHNDSLLSELFKNNTKLREIQIEDNNYHILSRLPNDIFKSQSNLIKLILTGNALRYLPPGLLRNLGKLEYLSLAHNYLTIPDFFFSSCKKLSTLNLEVNDIIRISANTFDGLISLRSLNMAVNDIEYVDVYAFRSMRRLEEINFERNLLNSDNLTILEPELNRTITPFYYVRNSIQVLNLEGNQITRMSDDWLSASKLRELSLKNNQLQYLSLRDIQFKSIKIVKLNLYNNRIRITNLSGIDSIESDRGYPVVELWLDRNPVMCDCSIYHLLRHRRNMTSVTSQRLFRISMHFLECAGPLKLSGTRVENLDKKSLLCAAPSTCPKACDCSFRAWDQALVINCSHRGLTKVPAALDLGSNGPVELNLTGNFVKSVPTLSQLGYHNLTVLSLSDNKISSLSLRNLSDNLTGLFLHGNNLTQLSEEDILFLANSTKLKNLTLHDNPWMCNCDTLNFLDFIQTKQSRFIELQLVTCNSMDTPVFNMTRDDVCPASVAPIIGGSVAFVLLLIVVISTAVYYRYEDGIKVWLFAHRLLPWLVNEAELDRDKIYDAFISYSHQDEDFVANTLVPKLEEGPRAFKLCVHYRDWLAGEFITEQIARSVADSRRTIVVLSRNFLASEWGRMEFRTAHSAALSEGRTRVIVIIYGAIGPIDEMEREMASYMRTNTYIKWGDKWFWEKLRYALPHPDVNN